MLTILLLRRLPFVFLARRSLPLLRETRDVLFLGWFGPVGVSALFYAAVSLRYTNEPAVWVVSSLVVCASIVVHGLSATPFVWWFGHRGQRAPTPSAPR